MKKLALAATALCGLAFQANAGVISVSVLDDGVAVPLICTGGVNAPISCSGASVDFATINVAAAGVPPLAGASLASVTIDATAATGGTHVLSIGVDQSGLNVTNVTGATSTFTVNNLVGGPFGPTTMTTTVNGSLLATGSFGVVTTGTSQSTDATPSVITSTGHTYDITFTGAGQSATDSIQLVTSIGVPEPMSLALLGGGIIGLGMLRGFRRSAATPTA